MAPEAVNGPPARSLKEKALDDLVMGTNSSSIVSKRSVERIYYPNEPHFFRFFVKKFQRRSPLINRGYHLRLHVVDIAVRNFLKRPSTKTKVVVNLGAGSDVLPWQCMTRYPGYCQGVKFIDVDFPDLMARKCQIIRNTPELNCMLNDVQESQHPLLLFQSNQYTQIGCDLRDLRGVQDALSQLVTLSDCEFMFLAEVSITYMETKAADAVIQWASGLSQAEFCLLEQILPDGADHPFAETMLQHFNKLKAPPRSVYAYPDLEAQKDRFDRLGWPHVAAETLWSAWSSDRYLTPEDRRRLNDTEPFDEWEELSIFGSHYCVVIASNGSELQADSTNHLYSSPKAIVSELTVDTDFSEYSPRCRRRFGSPMTLYDTLGQTFLANTFGFGNTSRLRSMDLHSSNVTNKDVAIPSAGPPSRMCHTVIDLGRFGDLLVGGRASPSSPYQDCWLFDKTRRTWQQLADLPIPLYRHAVTRLGHTSFALLVGGKTGSSSVFDGCLLYHPESGWQECKVGGPLYTPVFGATLVCFQSQLAGKDECFISNDARFEGVLFGGLLEDGTIAKQTLRWELELPESGAPIIRFFPLPVSLAGSSSATAAHEAEVLLSRFGASTIVDRTGFILILGGIIENCVLAKREELLLVSISRAGVDIVASGAATPADDSIPRPLLIGISAVPAANRSVVIMGGGATCFSMGSYWNRGCYTLRWGIGEGLWWVKRSVWGFHSILELTDGASIQAMTDGIENRVGGPILTQIPRVRLISSTTFTDILKAGKPVIFENCNLGPCTQTWTPDHLIARVGSDRKVVVHEAGTAKLDFNAKNFSYVTKGFSTFMQDVQRGDKMYMRALSQERPADKPANLAEDFPGLADEFRIPDEMALVTERLHSSVLRITGLVNMWLHYDVMANVYCQVVGTKRMILFAPRDVAHLSFAPGASSSSLDTFAELDSPTSSALADTQPHEAILNPGDILFLPPLWLHTAKQMTNLGVAVNLFFENLQHGYSSGRDVYGNRDLAAYERGRQEVARIASAFGKVPADMREFYLKRLSSELLQRSRE